MSIFGKFWNFKNSFSNSKKFKIFDILKFKIFLLFLFNNKPLKSFIFGNIKINNFSKKK